MKAGMYTQSVSVTYDRYLFVKSLANKGRAYILDTMTSNDLFVYTTDIVFNVILPSLDPPQHPLSQFIMLSDVRRGYSDCLASFCLKPARLHKQVSAKQVIEWAMERNVSGLIGIRTMRTCTKVYCSDPATLALCIMSFPASQEEANTVYGICGNGSYGAIWSNEPA